MTIFTVVRHVLRVGACGALLLVAACATGPKFDAVQTGFPAVPPDQGRIYIYRITGMVGAALQPAVKLDDVKIGESVAEGFFYVDRPPGQYTISTTTEKREAVTFTLAAGEVKYVRMGVGLGLFVGHVIPTVVDNEQGEREIRECHYTPPGPETSH